MFELCIFMDKEWVNVFIQIGQTNKTVYVFIVLYTTVVHKAEL